MVRGDMEHTESRCVLWVGDKHSGKTTAATGLVNSIQQEGYTVGGILAPSIYEDDQLVGFDIVDIRSNSQLPLAVRDEQCADIGPFRYYQGGLEFGHSALSLDRNRSSHLVVADEFGPLELRGEGWRTDVDDLLEKSTAAVLLVVRRQIAEEVKKLYAKYVSLSLDALDAGSVEKVLDWLKK